MQSIADVVAEAAGRTGFCGAVRVDRAGEVLLRSAYGFADRAYREANSATTQFALASGSKAMTALVVMSLVERGEIALDTTARSWLGEDLPLIPDDVTIEHLLAHRSGIGDYLDEGAGEISDYVLPVSAHGLATTEQFLPLLDGHEPAFPAGRRFAYNNGGYVVLALLAERVTRVPYHALVDSVVCRPAAMVDTAFLRSDELPARAARGYLSVDGLRTNVFHLPVLGSGDGGIYSTVDDLGRFWEALSAGRIVADATLAEMLLPRSDWPEEARRYGLGFHLHARTDAHWLEGYDAGVSFTSLHDPSSRTTYTVVSNWSDGAWPIVKTLNQALGL